MSRCPNALPVNGANELIDLRLRNARERFGSYPNPRELRVGEKQLPDALPQIGAADGSQGRTVVFFGVVSEKAFWDPKVGGHDDDAHVSFGGQGEELLKGLFPHRRLFFEPFKGLGEPGELGQPWKGVARKGEERVESGAGDPVQKELPVKGSRRGGQAREANGRPQNASPKFRPRVRHLKGQGSPPFANSPSDFEAPVKSPSPVASFHPDCVLFGDNPELFRTETKARLHIHRQLRKRLVSGFA